MTAKVPTIQLMNQATLSKDAQGRDEPVNWATYSDMNEKSSESGPMYRLG